MWQREHRVFQEFAGSQTGMLSKPNTVLPVSQGKHGLQFSPNDIEIFIMLFADDIILLSATIAVLQNQITAPYNAANRVRLQVNFNKTKVMVFRKEGHLSTREKWYYGSERLEVVNTYHYL